MSQTTIIDVSKNIKRVKEIYPNCTISSNASFSPDGTHIMFEVAIENDGKVLSKSVRVYRAGSREEYSELEALQDCIIMAGVMEAPITSEQTTENAMTKLVIDAEAPGVTEPVDAPEPCVEEVASEPADVNAAPEHETKPSREGEKPKRTRATKGKPADKPVEQPDEAPAPAEKTVPALEEDVIGTPTAPVAPVSDADEALDDENVCDVELVVGPGAPVTLAQHEGTRLGDLPESIIRYLTQPQAKPYISAEIIAAAKEVRKKGARA